MSEPLGKIEKPEAEQFHGKRKLLLITLVYPEEDAPLEYVEKLNRYWEQINQHIANLEAKIGKVNYVYHESVFQAAEAGIANLEKLNPDSYLFVKNKCEGGAVLQATEDIELIAETMDWERFIMTGFMSQKVASRVTESYFQAVKKRYEHIKQVIDQTLKASEVGMLLIREGHQVQFPTDVEVFLVAPPALDEIRRWQRNRAAATKEATPKDKEEPPDSTSK